MRSASFEERFWSKVNKDGPLIVPDLGPCWEWQGARASTGYGVLVRQGKRLLAHRVARELSGNPISAGAHGCHACDNPPCCNPTHVFDGSPRDNIADHWTKRRHALAILVDREMALRADAYGDDEWRHLNNRAWVVKHRVEALKEALATAEAELEAIRAERDMYPAPPTGTSREAAEHRYLEFLDFARELRDHGNLIAFYHECQRARATA